MVGCAARYLDEVCELVGVEALDADLQPPHDRGDDGLVDRLALPHALPAVRGVVPVHQKRRHLEVRGVCARDDGRVVQRRRGQGVVDELQLARVEAHGVHVRLVGSHHRLRLRLRLWL